jgi:hypothetical protein
MMSFFQDTPVRVHTREKNLDSTYATDEKKTPPALTPRRVPIEACEAPTSTRPRSLHGRQQL